MAYLVITILIIGLYTIKRRSLLNATFLFAAPYVFIILLNNNVMVNLGYFSIKETTFRVLLIFTVGLAIGSVIQMAFKKRVRFSIESSDLGSYISDRSISKINTFLWFVIIIRIFNILLSIRSVGLAALYANDFEALQLSGLIGHITLLGTALVPYVYKHYLKNKNARDLIVILAYCGVLFASFVKYHVIILIIVLFFEYGFFYPQKIIKAFIILFGSTLILFVGNYWLSFILRSINFSSAFAISKVWTYVAGGTITNDVLLQTESNSYSMGQWLLSIPSGIVNLFSSVIVGKPIIENVGWGHVIIGQTSIQAYWTNVYSQLTYLSQYSNILEMIATSIIIGFAGEASIPSTSESDDSYTKPTRLFILSFIFLNFFSNYFSLSSSWEIIGWSMLSGIIIRSLPHLVVGNKRGNQMNYHE